MLFIQFQGCLPVAGLNVEIRYPIRQSKGDPVRRIETQIGSHPITTTDPFIMKKYLYVGVCGTIVLLLMVVYKIQTPRHSKELSHVSERSETGEKKVTGPAEPLTRHADQGAVKKKARIAETKRRLTPELAALELEESRSIRDISQRASKCHGIIKELCENGYVEEAWALIEHDFGRVRTLEIEAFFGSLKVGLPSFEAKFKELYNAEEKGRAMDSRMENYKVDEVVSSLKNQDGDSEFKTLGNLDFSSFSNSVYNRLQIDLPGLPVEEREGRLATAHDLQQERLIRPVELIRMLWDMGDYSAFSKWEKLSQYTSGVDYGSDRGYIDHTRDDIVEKMVRESSVETIGIVLKSEGDRGSRDIQVAFGKWAELDSRGAAEWYEKNAATLSLEKKSSVAAGFFGKAFENNELAVARQWADQIADPKMRGVALGAIEKKEKKAGGE